MPLESALDFNAYVDTTTGHGVTGVFIEVQSNLWDSRLRLIDTWYDIDSGDSYPINLIIDQEYFAIGGGTVDVDGFQPRAIIKSSDAPYISQGDRLLVNSITTNKGNTLVPQTFFTIQTVEPDNTGLISLVLEEE
jgi:hypothetical protein